MRLPVPLAALIVSLGTAAAAQQVRVTKILLRSDLDGDGKPDSIVTETKRGPVPSLIPARAAVYLTTAPRARPSYATPWDDEYGTDERPDRVVPAGKNTRLLVLSGSGADNVFFVVLRVRRGSVMEIASHNIDYGEGDFDLKATPAGVTLRASPPHHLIMKGAPRLSAIVCAPPLMAAAVARFDKARGTFMPARQECVPRPRD